MKEVSCKVIAPLLREADRKKISPSLLVEGTSCSLAHLRNGKERIHWHEFIQIMANARRVWSEPEMVEIGKRVAASPLMLPLTLVARLLFTAKDFYFWLNKGPGEGGGGLLFTNMQPHCRESGPDRLEVDLLTREGYPLCREFYLLTLGAFKVVPTFLGLPEAEVVMDDLPNGVRYRVHYPTGGGLLQRGTKVLTWPFTARAVAKQLMEANDVLETRYQEIERSRIALALQARKLRTANEIGHDVHGDLDLSRTMASVTRALVEVGGFVAAEVTLHTSELNAHSEGERPILVEPIEVELSGRSLSRARVRAWPTVGADLAERRDLLDFVVPNITMALDNAVAYRELEDYQRNLERKVEKRTAELSQARDDLAGTVKALEEAKEIRDRIFANVNHDLRSPLSLVLLGVEEARAGGSLDPIMARTLDAIEHGARRVLRMVDELLLLAEGREKEVSVATTLCDLGKMAGAVATAWEPAARAAGLSLTHEVDDGLVVRADPNAIERILANLVSNAIKFTPKGGHVAVTVSSSRGEAGELAEAGPSSSAAGERAVLRVRDDGPGIDAELRSRLFGRFERGARAKGSAIGGSGLGLSLVKELAEAHGGSVSVGDTEERGATFRVELPLAAAARGEATVAASTALRPSDYGLASARIDLPSVYEPPGVARATILLAEDDPDLRDRTAKVLATEYRVLAAGDGLAALEMATLHAPALLVTDIAMPGIDGIELTKRFRALPRNRVSPVLVLTTFGGIGDRLAGFEAGAVDYIHKPFEPAELRARVRSQLALRALALQLLETEKLAALGTLSAGLAHEIRNPANGIINAVGPLRELLPPEAIAEDTPAAQLLDVIEHCSRQVATLSRELLGFKRGVEIAFRPVPIDTLLRRVKSTIRHTLVGIELREDLEYRGTVLCSEPLLSQVITNLFENAAHAAGRGGWISVRTALDEKRVVLELADSGPGVPEVLRERIFEPFFTTKAAGAGTGLGLSTARDIVLRHGGTLDVRQGGGGSVFRLELPSERALDKAPLP